MSVLNLVVIFMGLFSGLKAIDYAINLGEDAARPCPGKEDSYFDKFFDYSALQIDVIGDDLLWLNGYVKVVYTAVNNIYTVAELQKLSNGRWISTPFTIRRPDLCKSAFDKSELWHGFLDDFEDEERICPPKQGTKYVFRNKTMRSVINVETPSYEGTYRAKLELMDGEKYLCMILKADLSRIMGSSAEKKTNVKRYN